VDLTDYSNKHRHVLADKLPPLLLDVVRPGVIADVGCGDGALIYGLAQHGRLGATTYAIDLSPERVAAAEQVSPSVTGVVADATATTLPDASVDGVIVSQVIEHLENDRLLAPEVARILRPGGWWYIGSVLRRPHAWWIYKGNGQRLLDPTHRREYGSVQAFDDAIRHPDLVVTHTRLSPFRFPVLDLIARILAPARVHRLYVEHPRLRAARRITIGPPGYRCIEAGGVKRQ
jgi:ubiquinone/menaquinone biosynthesis C-methylase UbiE